METPNPQLVFPSFKPWNWEEKAIHSTKPLMQIGALSTNDIPLIGLGVDNPDVFMFYRKDEIDSFFDTLYQKAIQNVCKLKVSYTLVDRSYPLGLISGSYFACEKILDVNYMAGIQEKLGIEMMAVGMPRKGEMLVTDAYKPAAMRRFRYLVELNYNEQHQRPALTKTIFLVRDGKLQGIALPELIEHRKVRKPGFLARLFG